MPLRYGGSAHFPILIAPASGSSPQQYHFQRSFSLYYLIPSEAQIRGDYTPQIFVFHDCTVKALRSIIIDSLPTLPTPYSVDFFSGSPQGSSAGWSTTSLEGTSPILPAEDADQIISFDGSSIIVSVKAMHGVRGSMLSMLCIDPFPSPAVPPRVLAWTPSYT
jgi:hypothetical protein